MTTPTETPRLDAEVWAESADELGEGAISHPGRGSVLWFDILRRRLYERPFAGGATRVHELGLMASAAALVDRSRILIATEADLRLYDLDAGRAQPLCPFLAGEPDLRSNDGRVHPSGAFWISSMGKQADPEAGAIWWFRGGVLKLLFDRITIANAICFAPGGRAAYFADSPLATIWRVAVDPDTGMPSGDPVLFKRFTPDEGTPDGAVVDADGRIWTAAWGASAVHAWEPDGKRFESCRLPVSQPTCPAFFGPRLDEIVVTSARENMSSEKLAAEPLAGSVLKLRRTVRGVREPFVRFA
ncbi:MAG: SMP-30/gluconolactonase/LRE family protein [Hyphomicrobiaceae bacterium]|nr:SMP-30/gluconolactonase/LRE family protein [Hyphomicrobiaceae bacterium]